MTTDELLLRFEKLAGRQPTIDVINQAKELQILLAQRVSKADDETIETKGVRFVGGVDVAYDEAHDLMVACAVVMDSKTRQPLCHNIVRGGATFPYIPGLFSLRESKIAIEAIQGLSISPDILLIDAQGVMHERRFGLACHIGLRTGIPSIGVAKTPHAHNVDWSSLGTHKGNHMPINDEAGNVIGMALRTKDDVKPLFISTGHGISLSKAKECVLSMCGDFRQPETTRFTDHAVRMSAKTPSKNQRFSSN